MQKGIKLNKNNYVLNDTDRTNYWDLFVNISDYYSVQNSDGKYFPENSPLTKDVLFGTKTIGLYQLDKSDKVKWAVIDIDINKKIHSKPDFDIND